MNFKIIKYSKIIVNLINVCLPKIILLEYMIYILKIASTVININIKCFNLIFLFFIRKYNIYTLNGSNSSFKKYDILITFVSSNILDEIKIMRNINKYVFIVLYFFKIKEDNTINIYTIKILIKTLISINLG